MHKSWRSAWCKKAELSDHADSDTTKEAPPWRLCTTSVWDVHKKTISYCVKDGSGRVYSAGSIPATRLTLDLWMKTLPQPWTVAMEATIFTAWIYDHLQPHAAAVKVAHPLMLRAIAVAKKKNDRIDAQKIAGQRRRRGIGSGEARSRLGSSKSSGRWRYHWEATTHLRVNQVESPAILQPHQCGTQPDVRSSESSRRRTGLPMTENGSEEPQSHMSPQAVMRQQQLSPRQCRRI